MAVLEARLAGYSAARGYGKVKRLFDLALAFGLLIVLSPVMLAVALAIRLDTPGPVLFGQTRVGHHGQRFRMLKFRTMCPDRRVRSGAPPPDVGERRRRHKSNGDPRVTRVGRVLRRTALDELPQFWNVLRGEMSLVGPRPELPEIVDAYEPWQHIRHSVMPGVTGWWQINRDAGRLMHEQTDLDLYYVERRSFLLDLQILLRTIGVVIRGQGAF